MSSTASAANAAAPATPSPGPDLSGCTELGSAQELRTLLGEPTPLVRDKVGYALTGAHLGILARSPFCLVSTADAGGHCDASMRGDHPGFTHVLDATTIALPDRPGNRRADSFRNILENPHVGLLYLIPGSKEVLRINGRARLLTGAPFFDAMAVGGRRPLLALLVEIGEIYAHCPQSLRRSGLWRPETWEPAPGS